MIGLSERYFNIELIPKQKTDKKSDTISNPFPNPTKKQQNAYRIFLRILRPVQHGHNLRQ